ncbi:MAG: peptide chain release factor-like protein [Candidatus Omnitrophota bacterium]|nr:peptide chain release factor-like protein [Candidatus Omnitrophota bacterium]MDZ4243470.1 peptide chain release factor-like protein [Candidatus Omnitrophota bacterium]
MIVDTLAVSRAQAQVLKARMQGLSIREEDLEESFVRSSAKGGQNVNKVASCVCLVHRPTGIRVKCQEERSQAANRYRAFRLLLDRVEERRVALHRQAVHQREKLRRQKRRPSPAARAKILEDKRRRAERKQGRRRFSMRDI